MSETLELKAEPREVVKGGAKHLRRQGLVPAVVYGREVKTEPVQINAKALQKVLSVAGTHQLISLQIGNDAPRLTLARDVQRDVVRHNCLHVDFYAVKMDEKVSAQVPIVVIGTSPAVTEQGGILTQGLDELEIECLPTDLISSMEISVDGLTELNDTLTVADLTIPESVTILSDLESMVVKIEPPRLPEELEALDEEDEMAPVSAEPEVITEAREEDEPEEAE